MNNEAENSGRGGEGCAEKTNNENKLTDAERKTPPRREGAPPMVGGGEEGEKKAEGKAREKATGRGGEIYAGVWARSGEVVGRGGRARGSGVCFFLKRVSRSPSPSLPFPSPSLPSRSGTPLPPRILLPSETKGGARNIIGSVGNKHREFSPEVDQKCRISPEVDR